MQTNTTVFLLGGAAAALLILVLLNSGDKAAPPSVEPQVTPMPPKEPPPAAKTLESISEQKETVLPLSTETAQKTAAEAKSSEPAPIAAKPNAEPPSPHHAVEKKRPESIATTSAPEPSQSKQARPRQPIHLTQIQQGLAQAPEAAWSVRQLPDNSVLLVPPVQFHAPPSDKFVAQLRNVLAATGWNAVQPAQGHVLLFAPLPIVASVEKKSTDKMSEGESQSK